MFKGSQWIGLWGALVLAACGSDNNGATSADQGDGAPQNGSTEDGGHPSGSTPDGGGSSVPCSAATCAGCCNGNACVLAIAQSSATCGAAGAACQACPTDVPCNAGVCISGPTTGTVPVKSPSCKFGTGSAMTADGKHLYVIGGGNAGGLSVDTVVVFDVEDNAWRTLPSLLNTRGAPGGAAGPDGRIYAMGGYIVASGTVPSSVLAEVYDPPSNAWTALPNPPQPVKYSGSTTGNDGTIYVFSQAGTLAFDPQSASWTSLPNPPTLLYGPALAVGSDGRIYSFGGSPTYGSGVSNLLAPVTTVNVYDPASKSWSPLPSLTGARALASAVALPNGDIYVIGGLDTNDLGIASVEIFDTKAQSFRPGPPLNKGRGIMAAGLGSDGRIYAAVGQTRGPSSLLALCNVEVLTPGATSWLAGQ